MKSSAYIQTWAITKRAYFCKNIEFIFIASGQDKILRCRGKRIVQKPYNMCTLDGDVGVFYKTDQI